MDVVDFARRVYKLLGEREEDITAMLASGSPRNWEQYQSLVGELRGVAYAREQMKTLLEKHSDDELIPS